MTSGTASQHKRQPLSSEDIYNVEAISPPVHSAPNVRFGAFGRGGFLLARIIARIANTDANKEIHIDSSGFGLKIYTEWKHAK